MGYAERISSDLVNEFMESFDIGQFAHANDTETRAGLYPMIVHFCDHHFQTEQELVEIPENVGVMIQTITEQDTTFLLQEFQWPRQKAVVRRSVNRKDERDFLSSIKDRKCAIFRCKVGGSKQGWGLTVDDAITTAMRNHGI